jgi:hypothetical protein
VSRFEAYCAANNVSLPFDAITDLYDVSEQWRRRGRTICRFAVRMPCDAA